LSPRERKEFRSPHVKAPGSGHHPSKSLGVLHRPDLAGETTGWLDKRTAAAETTRCVSGVTSRQREEKAMRHDQEHVLARTVKKELGEGGIGRREFLRFATLLGVAAPAAYAFVEKVTGEKLVAPAAAQGALPKGGTLRIAMRCQDLKSPHTYSW